MEVTISAIIAELAGRSVSFLVDKYLNRTVVPREEEKLDSLRRLLRRAGVIVQEADDRRIDNQAMLHQLSILKKEMYRGHYTLDTLSCRANGEENAEDHQVSHAFTMSRFNPAKRVCLFGDSSQSVDELQQVLRSLEAIITDVNKFVVFFTSCPRLFRQPYSMYLILDKCMFGRQMEMERVVSFLLQPETSYGLQKPGVLPIIGLERVGKTTLVEHACKDERVRSHFSQIVSFSQGDIEDGNLRDGGVIKHQSRTSLDREKVLIIAELDGDKYPEENINEELLGRLYRANRIPLGSKIINTSRSNRIASFGTTLPLRLELFTPELFWYFFKVGAFGSTDAAEHPKLVFIALEMAREFDGCFLAANVFAALLRSNINARFWALALSTFVQYKQKNGKRGEKDRVDPALDVAGEPPAASGPRITDSLVVLDIHQAERGSASASAHSGTEAPKVSVLDVLFGSARPQGKFAALAWKSQIPPYYSYMFSCQLVKPKRTISRN